MQYIKQSEENSCRYKLPSRNSPPVSRLAAEDEAIEFKLSVEKAAWTTLISIYCIIYWCNFV